MPVVIGRAQKESREKHPAKTRTEVRPNKQHLLFFDSKNRTMETETRKESVISEPPGLSKLSLELERAKHPDLEAHHGEREKELEKENETLSELVLPPYDPAPAGTVFSDPTNFSIKHPLQHKWTLWYDNPRKKTTQDTWGNHLKKIVDIDTVEDFWRLYNNILPAGQLVHGSNYHFFKHGIEPKWEDAANQNGGKWVVNIPPKMKDKLDMYWLYTMLACIGETWGEESEDEVCGCVVSLRKAADRIALWTKTSSKEVATMAIGRHFKRALEMPDNIILGYQSHADSMSRNSSFANSSRYEV